MELEGAGEFVADLEGGRTLDSGLIGVYWPTGGSYLTHDSPSEAPQAQVLPRHERHRIRHCAPDP